MGIRQDKDTGIWHIDISLPGRPRIQRSSLTKNRKQAQELHDKLKNDAWREIQLGDKPKHTWDELRALWLDSATQNGKRSIDDDRDKLRWINPHMNNGKMLLNDITREHVTGILEVKRAEGKRYKRKDGGFTIKPVANGTINRYAALIKSMMKLAYDRGWITSVISIPKLSEPKVRVRWLTVEQASDLMAELPDYLLPLFKFALLTGLRQHNATHLEWSQVDLDRKVAWLYADQMKGKVDFSVPLADEAVDVLEPQKGKSRDWVFPMEDGMPIENPNSKAFKSACDRAGITDFHWHDIRHTWATWHVMGGTPLEVLKELGGWKSMAMVMRYAHFAQSYIAAHACNVKLPAIANMPIKNAVPTVRFCEESVSI